MSRQSRQRGQVVPLVAICLAVLMGFAALAVDVGYLQYQQRQQQSATDAAAIGGARALLTAGCPNSASATAAAKSDSASNGYTDGSGSVSVTVSNAPASGPFSSDNCAVAVQITSPHATFLSKLFRPSWNGAESTQAVATIVSNSDACIYLLDQTAQFQLNGTTITAPTCGILSDNKTVQANGGTIDVAGFGYSGSIQLNGPPSFPDAKPAPMLPVADPCPEIAGCAYLTANPPAASGCTSYQGVSQAGSIKPGCYNSIQVDGQNLTLDPGLYVLNGPLQINGGSLSGSGVTIYSTANGQLQANGNPVNLTPQTTGNYANVLYYQVPGNTSTVQLNGGSENVSGLIYAPSALGQYNGNSGNYVVLVFGTLQLNGSFNEDPGPPIGGSIVKNVVLAQ